MPECKLVFYGSTENGFWQGKSSDIDCSIVTVNPDDLFKLKDVVRSNEIEIHLEPFEEMLPSNSESGCDKCIKFIIFEVLDAL